MSTIAIRQPIPEGSSNALLQRLLLPNPVFELNSQCSINRPLAEAYIAQHFAREYNAHIGSFLPHLLTMRCQDNYSGAVGMRNAGSATLYLEQYLEQPIEQAIAGIAQRFVKRERIVEIGNLVSTQRGASHLIFLIFSVMLQELGTEWIAFTATGQVAQILSRLKFHTHTLCAADQNKLQSEEAQQWGAYYQKKPHVLVGEIKQLPGLIAQNQMLKFAVNHYTDAIANLVAQFQTR